MNLPPNILPRFEHCSPAAVAAVWRSCGNWKCSCFITIASMSWHDSNRSKQFLQLSSPARPHRLHSPDVDSVHFLPVTQRQNDCDRWMFLINSRHGGRFDSMSKITYDSGHSELPEKVVRTLQFVCSKRAAVLWGELMVFFSFEVAVLNQAFMLFCDHCLNVIREYKIRTLIECHCRTVRMAEIWNPDFTSRQWGCGKWSFPLLSLGMKHGTVTVGRKFGSFLKELNKLFHYDPASVLLYIYQTNQKFVIMFTHPKHHTVIISSFFFFNCQNIK